MRSMPGSMLRGWIRGTSVDSRSMILRSPSGVRMKLVCACGFSGSICQVGRPASSKRKCSCWRSGAISALSRGSSPGDQLRDEVKLALTAADLGDGGDHVLAGPVLSEEARQAAGRRRRCGAPPRGWRRGTTIGRRPNRADGRAAEGDRPWSRGRPHHQGRRCWRWSPRCGRQRAGVWSGADGSSARATSPAGRSDRGGGRGKRR